MSDFYKITTKTSTKGFEVAPTFLVRSRTKDLMIKGADFYAYYNPDTGLWSKTEDDVTDAIDSALRQYCKEKGYPDSAMKLMIDSDSGSIDKFHKYCQKQMRDNWKELDRKVIFADQKTTREDYASMKLPYSMGGDDISAYDELMSTLYDPEERNKLEWAIGAIISGDSRKIQKFIVLYGTAGSGKSTFLNIVQSLFEGYYTVFEAKELGQSNNAFALEPFKDNPLVAIQHDGDLSRIEDNTKLNSLISHEKLVMNVKHEKKYSQRFDSFLFMGTNRRVKITEAKSGIIRRLIDVEPSGRTIPYKRYSKLVKDVEFELGAIAKHCLEKYLSMGRDYYDDYISHRMISETNDFYDFMEDGYDFFKSNDPIGLERAWEHYKFYVEAANVQFPMSKRVFRGELKNYFDKFYDTIELDGKKRRNVYAGFKIGKFNFEKPPKEETDPEDEESWLKFDFHDECTFDEMGKDWPAQYATKDGDPAKKWVNVKTVLSDLDTTKLHWVMPPYYIICVDFDIKGEDGEKSFEKNLAAASKWPATYAELSKSGAGIHLYYIYHGDIEQLLPIYDTNVEVKVFKGNSSLRRKVSRHNNYYIATISSGLPLKEKGGNKVIDWKGVQDEKHLRTIISNDLKKKYMGYTGPSIDHIYSVLEDAYNKGISYDLSDMQHDVVVFAAKSSNQSERCLKTVSKMHFMSKDFEKKEIEHKLQTGRSYADERFVFFDIECYPNLLLICWKFYGNPIITKMRNPEPDAVEWLANLMLIGFNCRNYDNHICYARTQGYTIEGCYELSQKIISAPKGSGEGKFGNAYNWSYTDIYDYAATKQSLKKWEIEMGITHMEMGIPWDQPVPDDMIEKVEEYCCNDVTATEKLFDYIRGDFDARLMLVEMANIFAPNIHSIPNDTTNTLTQRIVFEGNKEPQSEFLYRDLAEPVTELDPEVEEWLWSNKPDMMKWWSENSDSKLPYFPGYVYKEVLNEKTNKIVKESTYKGIISGEGGLVWAKPGMYYNAITFDVASEHPSSIEDECMFGPEYTDNFSQIKKLRVLVKHKDFDTAKQLFDGKLAHLLTDASKSKALAQALKIAINAVYGQTAAHFKNPFHDDRNKDNIVAKRGALFMIDLLDEVQKRGGQPIHCKTDSIKLVNPTPEISDFIMSFGKRYGYDFEIEHKFEKICLVNNAVYVGKLAEDDEEWLGEYEKWVEDQKDPKKKGKPEPTRWTFTGTQFDVPYVRKTLFTKEPIEFEDLCETKSVQKGAIYLNMNESLSEGEDNYIFVGRVGQFCPIEGGNGGGELICINEPRIGFVSGTKGYRWLESAVVKDMHLEDKIDMSYYRLLAGKAVETIEKFGSYDQFVSDNDWMKIPDDAPEEIPFDED